MSDAEPPGGTPPPEDRPPLEPLRQVDHGRVLVDRAVLEMVRTHVASDPTVEHGGILVGHVDPASGITIVIDAIRGVGTVTRSASLTFTHETWDHVNDVMAEKYPDAKMVGWYHSHPGFGIFLSDYDQFIHRNFFLERWQIAYVDDPVLDKWGFFGWDGDELVRFGRWGTWSSDDGDGPMVAVPPAPVAPIGGAAAPPTDPPTAPPPPASPPPAPGPVLTVEADPEPRTGIRGWILGAGLFIAVVLIAFTGAKVFGGGDEDNKNESASEAGSPTPGAGASSLPATTSTTSSSTQDDEGLLEFPSIQVLNSSTEPGGTCAAAKTIDTLEALSSVIGDAFEQPLDVEIDLAVSEIYVADGYQSLAEQIAVALTLDSSVVVSGPYPGYEQDIVVVIGDDDAVRLSEGEDCG